MAMTPVKNDVEMAAPRVVSARGRLLEWSNVSLTIKANKKKQPDRVILDKVWGIAKPGETTAILGASGAGKTSLFRVLAGRIQPSKRVEIGGQVCLSQMRIHPFKRHVRVLFAYVAQQDALHESSTVREALMFSARLRCASHPYKDNIEKVNDLIQELGLTSCADRKISTLSGGERRRTSIGIELVADPSILFLDEPTSGLDSFAAKQVLGLLQRVAQAGNTVLFTIHQPSSDVFRSFDRLILLHKGQMMYQGMTKTVTMDFERLGYSIPDNYNPADWILDVAQGDSMEMLESHGFFPKEHSQDFSEYQDYNRESMKQTVHKVSCCIELEMLLHREIISLIRNPTPMIANVLITAFLSVVFGIIFLGVGNDDRSNMLVVQAVVGALVNTLMAVMMGQSQNALMIFSGERPLFMREYSTNHYTIGPYFFSKLVSEALQSCVAMMVQALITYFMIRFEMNFFIFFVILFAMAMTSTAVCVLLGAAFADPKIPAALFPLVVVPQFYFSGVFIATNLIPVGIRWIQWLCSLKYAAGLAYIYELDDCGSELADANCSALLLQNNVSPDDKWWYWLALLAIFCVFRLAALLVLRKKGCDFS
jgi:ABC-type multidrug transport system ATPase subunit/ABC-type multidrug transport system permease subunit